MSLKRKILYTLFSVLMIVSFQNCGQSGSIGLESQDLGKIAANDNPANDTDLIDISDDPSDDQNDTQNPPSAGSGSMDPVKSPITIPPKDDPKDVVSIDPVKSPVVVPTPPKDVPKTGGNCDDKDDSDTSDIVEADNDGNVIGPKISCSDLIKVKLSILPGSSGSNFNKTRGLLKVENEDDVSVVNHRGILILNNINTVSNIENVRSLLMRVNASSVKQIDNARALSLINSENIESVSNYRGLGCVSSNIGVVENYRGILEVRGDLVSVKNFRGILKVNGSVKEIENFRGVLIVSGSIGSKKDVKVRMP